MAKDSTTINDVAKAAKKAGLIKVDLRKPLTNYAKSKLKRLQSDPLAAPVLFDYLNRIKKPEKLTQLRYAEQFESDNAAALARAAYEKGERFKGHRYNLRRKIRGEKEAKIFRANGYYVYGNHVFIPVPNTASKVTLKRTVDKLTGSDTIIIREKQKGNPFIMETPLTLSRLDIIARLNQIINLEKQGRLPRKSYRVRVNNHTPFKTVASAKDLLHYLENIFEPNDENISASDLYPLMTEVDNTLYIQQLAREASALEKSHPNAVTNPRTFKPAKPGRQTKRRRIKGR